VKAVFAAAERFWNLVGFEEQFPRALEGVIALALPVTTVHLPRLTPRSVSTWLAESGIQWNAHTLERPLRGFLIAHRGHGFIFVDGSMASNELRLTIAHELAHFLLHYLLQRESAISRLGDGIQAVLDGDRAATTAEKLSGVLHGVQLGPCEHLIDRDLSGAMAEAAQRVEVEADLLAFELLAPTRIVLSSSDHGEARRRVLMQDFGFPAWAAGAWGGWLDSRFRENSLIQGLKVAAKLK
jgi:hypothetical protein